MSAKLVEGIQPHLLKAHYAVNEEISARNRARQHSTKDFTVNS
jgi:hypothetical protein